MAQVFPKWTNKIPLAIVVGTPIVAIVVILLVWYYFSPKYTDVSYRPIQPVEYSHKVHAGDLKTDCRYCHSAVEISPVANVPPTQTCMNCHKLITPNTEKMQPVLESFISGKPIEWVRVHNLPDYVYFDHSAHLRVGVGCASCHGNIASMEVVRQAKPLSMGWCLDCHRDPDMYLRPHSEITKMTWKPPHDQLEFAEKAKRELNIAPPVDCSGCHR